MELRRCYRCEIEKPPDAFTTHIDDRHYNMCRACVSEVLTRPRPESRRLLTHTSTHRTCYLCRRVLAVASFTRRSNDTYFSACKDCNRHVFGQRRRARLAGASGSYTAVEWEALVAQHDRCPMCLRAWADIPPHPGSGVVITADHIIPVSKQGANSIDNIRPLCYSCNSRKGAKKDVPGKTLV